MFWHLEMPQPSLVLSLPQPWTSAISPRTVGPVFKILVVLLFFSNFAVAAVTFLGLCVPCATKRV